MSSNKWEYIEDTVTPHYKLSLKGKGTVLVVPRGREWYWGLYPTYGQSKGGFRSILSGFVDTKQEAMDEGETVLGLIDEE